MITIETICRIADLAQISLSEAERKAALEKLQQVIKLVDGITATPTEGVLPLSHPFAGMSQPLRADVVTETNIRDTLQTQAPAVAAGFYVVPAVMGES